MTQIGEPYKRGIGEPAKEPEKAIPIGVPQPEEEPIPVEPQREKVKVPAEGR